MRLYLGEGSRDYLETIRDAVSAWNGLTARGLIELREEQVSYPLSSLPPNAQGADEFYADGASVLYFSSQRTGTRFGYTLTRLDEFQIGRTRIAEADVFIWTPPATSSDLDLLIALQHQLGHALGLDDTPISGNVMSYDYRPAIEDVVYPFIYLGLLPHYDNSKLLPGQINLFDDPQHASLLRKLVRPQAQDKTAFLCMYSFGKWGQL